MSDDALFLDLFANQSSLIKRLAAGFCAAARDFAADPAGYITSAFKDHRTGQARRRDLLRFGMATIAYAVLTRAPLHRRCAAHRSPALA